MNLQVYRFFRGMAFVGIAVLTLIALLSVVSIVGRSMTSIGLGPVRGDFELVEIGSGIAVFCFLPWAHLRKAHAVVDILWGRFPAAMQAVLTVVFNALMLAAWLLLVWRMGVQWMEYRASGETTFVLLMPLWWGYTVAMVPAVLGLFAYVWKLIESLGWVAEPPAYMDAAKAEH